VRFGDAIVRTFTQSPDEHDHEDAYDSNIGQSNLYQYLSSPTDVNTGSSGSISHTSVNDTGYGGIDVHSGGDYDINEPSDSEYLFNDSYLYQRYQHYENIPDMHRSSRSVMSTVSASTPDGSSVSVAGSADAGVGAVSGARSTTTEGWMWPLSVSVPMASSVDGNQKQ
jgi:hypothetical protein